MQETYVLLPLGCTGEARFHTLLDRRVKYGPLVCNPGADKEKISLERSAFDIHDPVCDRMWQQFVHARHGCQRFCRDRLPADLVPDQQTVQNVYRPQIGSAKQDRCPNLVRTGEIGGGISSDVHVGPALMSVGEGDRPPPAVRAGLFLGSGSPMVAARLSS